jgi:glycosyltransferase involved in cell wall biosynthesis
LISVGLPAYKAKYLKEAIESVLKQTYCDFELIIINDASPENIKEIVKSFNEPRIRYYENEKNLGKESLVQNWNKVLSLANGEYFVLFSDDDIYESTFLQEMLDLMRKYPNVQIAHCRVEIIDENGKTLYYSPSCPEYEDVIDFMWHRLKGLRDQFAPDFMTRTEMLKGIGGFVDFPLAWSSDDATWFTLAKESGIAFLNKPLFKWRLSNSNISKIGSAELRIKANILYNEWANNFVTSVEALNKKDKLKIERIKKLLPVWRARNISGILSSTSGDGFLSLLRILQKWLKFRKKYQLNLMVLIMAVMYKVKRMLFA